MTAIRTTLLIALVFAVVALGAYRAAQARAPQPAPANADTAFRKDAELIPPVKAQPMVETCPLTPAEFLTVGQLRNLLDRRYLHRVGLPR